MAMNPMQKKARNAFILGAVVTLIICLLLAGLLYFLFIMPNQAKEDKEGALTYVYRLKKDIRSGKPVTAEDVESMVVTSKVVPEGAFASKVKTQDGKDWIDKSFPEVYTAKIDLKEGTIISSNMLNEGQVELTTQKYVEYNMLTLSTQINVNDFVDIRLTLPNGQDLVVVSKKEVKFILGNTVGFEMTEGEIEQMESAVVESYIMPTSKLYVAKYMEPGLQNPARKTYTPTEAAQEVIANNPDIVEEALKNFSAGVRGWINTSRLEYVLDEEENLEERMQEEIENAKAAREAYLSGLTSY